MNYDELNDLRELSRELTDRRQVNRILHGFPSVRYWTETDLDKISDSQAPFGARETLENVDLYAGIPYCIKTKETIKDGYCKL